MQSEIITARQLLQAGDRIGARAVLMPLARTAPTGEVWYLLGQALDDAAQRKDCLVRAAQAGWVEPLAVAAPAPVPAPVPAPTPAPPPPPPPPPAAAAAPLAVQASPSAPPEPSDRQLIERASQGYAANGWQIVSQTEHTAQFKYARKVSQVGLVVFVLLPLVGACLWYPLLGVAVFGLLFVGLDYLIRKDKLDYITADQLRSQYRQAVAAAKTTGSSGVVAPPAMTLPSLSTWRRFRHWVIILGVVLFGFALFFAIGPFQVLRLVSKLWK